MSDASTIPRPSVGPMKQMSRALARPTMVLMIVCTAVVAIAVLVPSSALIWESLTRKTQVGTVLTFDNYIRVLQRARTYTLLWNTVLFSAAMTLVSGALGFIFAWIAARTNTPLRRFMPVAILLPYLLPPSLGAILWILLLAPQNGIINAFLEPVFGPGFFNIYSFSGMVFVESLYTVPLSFVFFYATLVSLNPTLEEASAVAGAGTLRTFFHTTVPNMWPTIISVATILFILGFESFDVAWFLGYPAKIFILSIEVYVLTRIDYPSDVAGAAVYGVIALAAALILVAVYRHVTRERDRYAAITGKAYHTAVLDIGPVRYVACAIFYGLILIFGVLPLLLLIAMSLHAVSWPFAINGQFSGESYRWIFTDSQSLRALANSAELAILGALVVVVASFFVGYLSMRTHEKGRGLLDYLSFLPFAFPGTVLAIGIVSSLIRTPIYNTIWIMLLAYGIKFLPYGLRNVSNNMLQIHRELEEASFIAGGGLLQTMYRIVLPLTRPGLVAAWSLLFIVFMRQFSLPIMLASPGSQVATIMIFQEWDAGNVGHVAAYGIVLAASCVPFLIVARYLGREV